MTLAHFIEHNMEAILADWESFAKTLPGGVSMDIAGLRTPAKQLLEEVCEDMVFTQTRELENSKSHGLALPLDAAKTAAQTHALQRARSGFSINEMASEYRALRASVLSLWIDTSALGDSDLSEIMRFNEAIDKALCESIVHFSQEVDRARNLLLGVLGHDLRTPLSAIQMTAQHLKKLNLGSDVSIAAERLIRSGGQMKGLLDDLTAFNRKQLGLGISVSVVETDLSAVFEDQLQQLRAAYPAREITLEVSGDLRGKWDPARLQQVLGNLVVNALRYGASERPVRLVLYGLETEVVFHVKNEGKTIPAATLAQLFDPLRRGADRPDEQGSLGLGLYICREISLAHGGSILAESTESGTVFTVRLPRNASNVSPRAAKDGSQLSR